MMNKLNDDTKDKLNQDRLDKYNIQVNRTTGKMNIKKEKDSVMDQDNVHYHTGKNMDLNPDLCDNICCNSLFKRLCTDGVK